MSSFRRRYQPINASCAGQRPNLSKQIPSRRGEEASENSVDRLHRTKLLIGADSSNLTEHNTIVIGYERPFNHDDVKEVSFLRCPFLSFSNTTKAIRQLCFFPSSVQGAIPSYPSFAGNRPSDDFRSVEPKRDILDVGLVQERCGPFAGVTCLRSAFRAVSSDVAPAGRSELSEVFQGFSSR